MHDDPMSIDQGVTRNFGKTITNPESTLYQHIKNYKTPCKFAQRNYSSITTYLLENSGPTPCCQKALIPFRVQVSRDDLSYVSSAATDADDGECEMSGASNYKRTTDLMSFGLGFSLGFCFPSVGSALSLGEFLAFSKSSETIFCVL